MLKKMRIMSTILAIAVFSTVITSCGSSETAETPKEGISSEATAKDEPVELIWYSIASQPPADMQVIMDELNPYLLEKINATIDVTMMSYADYNDKLPLMINSGEVFDICFTSSGDNPYVYNASKGAFYDLTPYLETVGKEMYEAIDKRFWKAITIDGKIYSVPTQKELGIAPVMKFSNEIIEKGGIELPEYVSDLDVLGDLLAQGKEADPDTIPLGINKNGFKTVFYNSFDALANGNVPAVTPFTGDVYKVINPFETEFALNFCLKMREFYEKGYLPLDASTAETKPTTRFADYGSYQPYAEDIWERVDGYRTTVVPMQDPIANTSAASGSMHAVSITSPNPEKAVEFLNLLNTDPFVKNTMTFGVEGIHYEKTGDNSIKLLDKAADYSIPAYTMANNFIGYTIDPDPADKWETFKTFNDETAEAPLFGFTFNGESVKNQAAAVKAVSQQYYTQVFTGNNADVEGTIAEFNEKLYNAGLQDIINELQKQVDAYVENNNLQ
ncbi:MAG: ABC transporter substrate-binding protein [Lachnospirales bacterium]